MVSRYLCTCKLLSASLCHWYWEWKTVGQLQDKVEPTWLISHSLHFATGKFKLSRIRIVKSPQRRLSVMLSTNWVGAGKMWSKNSWFTPKCSPVIRLEGGKLRWIFYFRYDHLNKPQPPLALNIDTSHGELTEFRHDHLEPHTQNWNFSCRT